MVDSNGQFLVLAHEKRRGQCRSDMGREISPTTCQSFHGPVNIRVGQMGVKTYPRLLQDPIESNQYGSA